MLLLAGAFVGTAEAGSPPDRIVFPLVGSASYTDDFGAPRGDHGHQGNDLVADRWTPVVAVEAGRVEIPGWRSRDCALILHGASGTDYWYLHLNDRHRHAGGEGGCRPGVAYAPGLDDGDRVRAGELVGYVGNSGNAAGVAPHLHFELHPGGGRAVSPYEWLRRARRVLFAVPGGRTSVRLALYGTVRSIDDAFALRVASVAVSRGWRGSVPARAVALAYAADVTVERTNEARNTPATAAVSSAVPGERVAVWTTWFAPTLATQLAQPNVLSAQRIRLRGPLR
ncbi:MAG TPA: M23 family metallopeptidase [Gaiellaceae bacterium]|nr:M23 family metallopeptidase [Gaiellaceae bacterium]